MAMLPLTWVYKLVLYVGGILTCCIKHNNIIVRMCNVIGTTFDICHFLCDRQLQLVTTGICLNKNNV